MTHQFPMTLLAQIDDVAVFQTAAFSSDDVDAQDQPTEQLVRQQRQANYGELNLGLHVNDDAAKVLSNRMRLLSAINEQLVPSSSTCQQVPIKRLHWVNQVHGKQIHDIDGTALGMMPMSADAMVSRQQGLGLAIMTADCVPIVLYQPASGQMAAIHAGWQGLACGVIQATVHCFTQSGQIEAWIGVCISQDSYEVGAQVRNQLLKGCTENKLLNTASIEHFDSLYVIDSVATIKGDSNTQHVQDTVDKLSSCDKVDAMKIKLNLPKLAADQLSAAGVIVDDTLSSSCSYADDHYYSYRRQTHLQQPATGRMALGIVRGAA
ncbi:MULTISPECIES: polyphenol oxidase family protein [unclassified Psychrobacter]|uniref:polyphenol oxidase family protein n=1 Tax=unclassified Psychrobacter TaxID=196806 RepID=UPI000EEDCF89|nr:MULTISPECIES: polyphenol oxidase family protein [unclassified Psychrobacter]MBE8609161.1 laccase domain-containing protein [Pseudomonas lundensis]HCI74703.1 laccase domain-containing protein [Psychrobacter sp.]